MRPQGRSDLSEECAISAQAAQEVVDVNVTGLAPHIIHAHPACLGNLIGVSDGGCSFGVEVVEVVLSYGESLVGDG